MEAIQIENFDKVIKRTTDAGFNPSVAEEIKKGLAAGLAEIHPSVSEIIENQRIDFDLEVKVKDNKGYYNGFKATLYNEDGTNISQWFKAADRITVNESFLLLMDQQHPRAVQKTYFNEQGEKYGEWVQLDFNQKTDYGNFLLKRHKDFDLVAKLKDYEFVELNNDKYFITAAAILAEGREIQLTPVNQEKYNEVFIRANPEKGTVTFLDVAQNHLYHDQFRTQAARDRIQQEKNARQSSVSFVRDPKANIEQAGDSEVKKKSDPEQEQLKTNKKPRELMGAVNKKGKSI